VSVSTKLWGGFLATILLGAVLIYELSVIRDLAEANQRLATISTRVAVIGTEQLYRLDQLQENSAKYRVTRDPRYAEQFVLLASRIRSTFGDLDTLSLTREEQARVDRIGSLLGRFDAVTRAFEDLVDASEASPGAVELAERGEGWIEDLRTETVLLTEASRAAMLEEASASARNARLAERRAWVTAALVLVLGAIVAVTVARSISRGLNRLAAGTRRVAQGEFEVRLTGSREREFRNLEADFNVMVERLSELERMKKDFLAGISHDLKSPLASIRETLRVLLDEVPGPIGERQRRLLGLADQSGERLAAMISNLLDLAQMEAQAVRYRFREDDLAGVVRGVVEEMETRFQERNVELEVTLPESLPVECDSGRMAQVVQNLIENALAVSPPGSTIQVEGSVDGESAGVATSSDDVEAVEGAGSVVLTVADRGPGVPEDMAETIFDRFVRGNGRSATGVGLGLTICREIVTAHGGRIWVEDRPGGGSVFAFELPRVRDARRGEAARIANRDATTGRRG